MDTDASHAALTIIHQTTDPGRRRRLVEDFHRERIDFYTAVASKGARRYGAPRSQIPDLAQEVGMLAAKMVESWDPSLMKFEAMLHVVASRHIRELVNSPAWVGVSGASLLNRRRGHLIATQRRLAREHGVEPTDEQVVEAWNREAKTRFGDPGRAGMIASLSDFTGVSVMPREPQGDSDSTAWAAPGSPDMLADTSVLSAEESPEFVAAVIEAARSVSDELGTVAEAWLGSWGPGETRRCAEIREVAAALGQKYEWVRRRVNQLKVLAVEVAVTDFGITSP